MRLERVEIVGFKSFCDKQELSFQGGVTGIVGPNGCGKSNISDAISWVLGEQSAKSLRGTAMEDVIFAGSQSRQPLAMAEVNLRVTGLNGKSPDGSGECIVSRRLYRNGESEYLMNGDVCRLKDIHELFMDTGLGSKAYSIIEQGKIGLILSSKPADRRALIEEAAGITKYKARRRQSQLKLDAAQQNLLRVNDIVHEVEKQLESLKRQAGKARRYRALREQITGVERVLFGRRYLELSEQLRGLDERLSEQQQREQAVSVALQAEEAQLEARRTGLYEEDARLEEARARMAEHTLAAERHQGRSTYAREQIAQAEARAAEADVEAVSLQERMGPLVEQLAGVRAESARMQGEREAAEAEQRAAEAALRESVARHDAAQAGQEQAREAQVGVLERLAMLQNAREATTGNAERAAADLLKLAEENQQVESERALANESLERARLQAGEAEALAARLVAERDAASGESSDARREAESAGREAEALQSERDSLAGRLQSLEEMVATHSAFDEGVRALLQKPASGPPGTCAVMGVVADSLETDSRHERAVEAFFGERLQYVLTPHAGHAVRHLRYLQATGAGRVTFLTVEEGAPADGAEERERLRRIAASEPSVRALLSAVYRVSSPHEAAIRAALPEALVVDTLEDALDLAGRHGAVPCATLAGETLRGALIEGGRAVHGLLAPKREVKEILARLEDIESRLQELRQRERDFAARASEAAARAHGLEESIHAAEKQLVALRRDHSAAEEELARLHRKAAILDTERRQAEQERGEAALRLAEIEQGLARAEEEKERGRERLAALAAAVADARAATDAAQARSAEARSRLAALRERVVAAEGEAGRLEREREDLEGRIAAAHGRADQLRRQREELREEMLAAERQLAEALGARDRAQGEVIRIEEAVRGLREELETREAALKERRQDREVLRDALADVEVQRARCQSDLDHLARESQQAVQMTAAQASASLTEAEQAAVPEELQARLAELREKLDRIGPVNVLAVEQTQELEERHLFMTSQRQDLLESITELEQGIKRIDRASRERFTEAFQTINQHFGEVFRQLFGGGTAGLSLLDEEDVLESGIDVMAQPPGKRLQSVMLLSGGEKALTAIALLFAIFQYKPSPFCILDEVDAPLDDANIGRFVRMLEGLKEQTQFILITHSRRTMEIADQLYGVTMEEPGVSKLVSVRLN
jgi:chromosome segregation protein